MRNLLLSGRPGVGKTTLIKRLARAVEPRGCGFYTDELRENGSRVGFAIVTLSGYRDVLAHVDYPEPQRVGKYGVKPQRWWAGQSAPWTRAGTPPASGQERDAPGRRSPLPARGSGYRHSGR